MTSILTTSSSPDLIPATIRVDFLRFEWPRIFSSVSVSKSSVSMSSRMQKTSRSCFECHIRKTLSRWYNQKHIFFLHLVVPSSDCSFHFQPFFISLCKLPIQNASVEVVHSNLNSASNSTQSSPICASFFAF